MIIRSEDSLIDFRESVFAQVPCLAELRLELMKGVADRAVPGQI